METIKLTQTRNYTHAISVANSLIRIATCLNTFELTQKRSRSNAVSEASALVVEVGYTFKLKQTRSYMHAIIATSKLEPRATCIHVHVPHLTHE